MAKPGGFFVRFSQGEGTRVPEAPREGIKEHIARPEVRLIKVALQDPRLRVRERMEELEEEMNLSQDVRDFLHDFLLKRITPRTPEGGRTRIQMLPEINPFLEELALRISVAQHVQGRDERHPNIRIGSYDGGDWED